MALGGKERMAGKIKHLQGEFLSQKDLFKFTKSSECGSTKIQKEKGGTGAVGRG